MDKFERIIVNIREMMVANAPSTGGAYSSQGDQTTKGGFDPLIGFTKRKNKSIDYRSVNKNWKNWVKDLENKSYNK